MGSAKRGDVVTIVGVPPSMARDVQFTIGTLVTDVDQYRTMRETFFAAGFGEADCEYLQIDNSHGTQACAYQGLNAILARARGRYVILCHQDVRLLAGSDRAALVERLSELDARDPAWALAGNGGGVSAGALALRITDPHGADRHIGPLPARVMSLDENFIVVRRDARIGFSRDLTGFHFYGADICLAAEVMGYSAYVIDFHLTHLSGGRKDRAFEEMEERFRAKWSHALRPRWMQTTCSLVRLTGHRIGQVTGRLAERPYRSLSRRMPGAKGWNGPKDDDPSAHVHDDPRAPVGPYAR